MKLKHLLLFIISCAVLILSDLTAGPLIALAILFQLLLLANMIPLSKSAQIAAFKIFLFSLPTFLFWGGVHSFIQIYFFEGHWGFLMMAMVIALALCLIVSLQCILIFKFLAQAEFHVGAALQETFNSIQKNKGLLFKTTGLVFIFSMIPWLTTDWKLIFSVMATSLYLNWDRLMPELLSRPS